MYEIGMTQDEVVTYLFILLYTNSDRYASVLDNLRDGFASKTPGKLLRPDIHKKWVRISPEYELFLKKVDEDYIERKRLIPAPIQHDDMIRKYKYIVKLSQIEVILLNSVSGLVAGNRNSLRRYSDSSTAAGTMIFERIFGIADYRCTIELKKGSVFMEKF